MWIQYHYIQCFWNTNLLQLLNQFETDITFIIRRSKQIKSLYQSGLSSLVKVENYAEKILTIYRPPFPLWLCFFYNKNTMYKKDLWHFDRVSAYFSDASQNFPMHMISLVSFLIGRLMY